MANASCLFPRIVLFGDSITQQSFSDGGWGSAIAECFQRKCDVLNRGFSGYTSAYNRLVLPRLLLSDNHPQGIIVTAVILLGSNDSALQDKDPRGLKIQDYTSYMREIVSQFKNAGIPAGRLILMTPPPVSENMWMQYCIEMEIEMNLSSTRTKEFASACADIGQKEGIQVVDLHTSMQRLEDWPSLLSDGLHLSRKGNQFVAQQLIPVLQSKLEDLPLIFPDWKDVDAKDPEKTLGKYSKV